MFIGITGHQDIPKTARVFIEGAIRKTLDRYKENMTGVSSLAAGADQMFAEILLQMHGRLHVIVPSQNYEASFDDESALACYKKLVREAVVVETCQYSSPSEKAYFEAGRKVVSLSGFLIAIWDGKQSTGEGGTADIVRYAHECNKQVHVIWPTGMDR